MHLYRILLMALVLVFQASAVFSQNVREIREITVSGSGYERGLQHGKQLNAEIGEIIAAWRANTSASLERDADEVLAEFFEKMGARL